MVGVARDLARRTGRRLGALHELSEPVALAAHIDRHGIELLVNRNSEPAMLDALPPFRGIHVIRDPRDLVVSAYYSHRNSHRVDDGWPALSAHRARLRTLDLSGGLLAELEFSEPVLAAIDAWDYDRPELLELRLEDLFEDSHRTTVRVARHLGVVDDDATGPLAALADRLVQPLLAARARGAPVPMGPWRTTPAAVGAIARARSFEAVTGRRPGDADANAHQRKGQAGDWREHFGPEHRGRFAERWGDLLVRLGYEPDDSWAR